VPLNVSMSVPTHAENACGEPIPVKPPSSQLM